jgi:wyosine [tRNA(Phe)-imidazoG37] synthetase (radical SAM superfamily)
MIAFGPVPSRRLGRSLGINNIPPKVCTFACVYCQLGRTLKMQIERRAFYEPDEVLKAVQGKVEKAADSGESVDYLTFVPDGEPTLDVNLGREIELVKPLGIKTAVITNASLLWREDVQEDLMDADWVSLKVDAVQEDAWRRVDRPHGSLQLNRVLDGMLEFASAYRSAYWRAGSGELVTETMLVGGVNDDEDHVRDVADFLARLGPDRAYLAIPTRPPGELWVRPPVEKSINRAYQILSESVDHVEYLIGYEGNAFAFTGDVEEDLLSITAVHPMREDAVREFLARADAGWPVVRWLIARDQLVEAEYDGHRFYMRKLRAERR